MVLKLLLESLGATVIRVISSMEEVMALTEKDLQDCHLALVDGTITPEKKDPSNEDGATIANLIRSLNPSIKILGIPGTGEVAGADHSIEKGRLEANRVKIAAILLGETNTNTSGTV